MTRLVEPKQPGRSGDITRAVSDCTYRFDLQLMPHDPFTKVERPPASALHNTSSAKLNSPRSLKMARR
jgi:hypothetical protein